MLQYDTRLSNSADECEIHNVIDTAINSAVVPVVSGYGLTFCKSPIDRNSAMLPQCHCILLILSRSTALITTQITASTVRINAMAS